MRLRKFLLSVILIFIFSTASSALVRYGNVPGRTGLSFRNMISIIKSLRRLRYCRRKLSGAAREVLKLSSPRAPALTQRAQGV